jgi:hypothetical protein
MATLFQTALDDVAKKNAIQPDIQQFDESKGVAGRVNSITNSASPLMQAARTRAAQASSNRGLLNSSLGVQAGEQAVIETATPIASADAQLFQQQSLTNQQARNTANQQNANNNIAANTRGLELDVNQGQFSQNLGEQARQFDVSGSRQQAQFDASRADNARMFDAELGQKAEQFKLTQNQTMALAKMDVNSKIQLAEIEAKYKNEIQGSANISNAWGTTMQGIAAIQTDPNLDEATKAALINNNLQSFQSYSNFWRKLTGGAIDVSDLLSFGVEPAPQTPGTGGGGGGAPGQPGAPGEPGGSNDPNWYPGWSTGGG